jgi:hypothetical protein
MVPVGLVFTPGEQVHRAIHRPVDSAVEFLETVATPVGLRHGSERTPRSRAGEERRVEPDAKGQGQCAVRVKAGLARRVRIA